MQRFLIFVRFSGVNSGSVSASESSPFDAAVGEVGNQSSSFLLLLSLKNKARII